METLRQSQRRIVSRQQMDGSRIAIKVTVQGGVPVSLMS